ncbi:MAG: MBL fold metallo-hydrolase [Janthinobacterium lividum]
MSKIQFASVGDTKKKEVSFDEIAPNVYAYTTQGDPNSGVIIGDKYVMVVEAQSTPVMAQGVIDKIRTVTDKPIKYVVLTHYHAVRVLGTSAYDASETIMSEASYDMVVERGQQDYESEVGRFPRLFEAVDTVPGLTWPSITFTDELTIDLGNRKVEIKNLGSGHTKGDSIVWLPAEKVLFAGDLVEYGATPYCGDAQLAEWPATLDNLLKLEPAFLVPGRGEVASGAKIKQGIDETRRFVTQLLDGAKEAVKQGLSLEDTYKQVYSDMKKDFGDFSIFDHSMPFNVSRAFDEASGIVHPNIWNAVRDKEIWYKLQELVQPTT